MKHLLTFIFCLFSFLAFSQIPAPQLEQARAELEKRGITEAEMRAKLEQKGINIDTVDPSNPAEVARVQKAVEEALREIEAEKKAVGGDAPDATQNAGSTSQSNNAGANKSTPESSGEPDVDETTDNIRESVEDGASVEEALSEELNETKKREYPPAEIYGQQLFRDQSLKLFRTTTDAKPPNSYVLGTGDEVSISIFGISQADFTFEIPESGFIKPSGMPRILLKGITYGQAKKLLRNRFGAAYVFQPEQFAVTLSTARSITVNIFGEVLNFGSFNISALNTAFNALVAAGGPSNIGSVRNIQVISNGESKRLDVYEFMNNPAAQFDFSLNNNDIINVPVAQRVIKIEGAVRRPFKYELLENENLNDLIRYAGGLNDNAYRSNLQIIRFENDREVIIDVNLNELKNSGRDFKLLAGDIVNVKDVERTYENFVSVEGAVELEGQFQLTEGMRISDLVRKSGLRNEARTDIAFLLRTGKDETVRLLKVNLDAILADDKNPANLSLQPKDRLEIYKLERFTEQPFIEVNGAIRDTVGKYELDPGVTIKVQEAITLAGGLLPDAMDFAYLVRQDSINTSLLEYIRIDLNAAMSDANSSENISLQPYDKLTIPSDTLFFNESTVEVVGAVSLPKQLEYAPGITLRDILSLAGGLKPEAARSRIDVFRIEFNDDNPTQSVVATVKVDENLQVIGGDDLELQPFDYIVVREVPDFELQQKITIEGEVKFPGVYALIGDNEKLSSVLERAGGLSAEAFPAGATLFRKEDNTGFIVTQLDEVMKNPRSRFNYVLKEGDVITIPKSKDLVTIKLGNTEAAELYPDRLLGSGKVNIAYEDGKDAKWYIDKYAAGIAETGSRRRISVEHPNGRIEDTKDYLVFKDYPEVRPGSIINIGAKPVKEEKEKEEREPIDWEKIVSNSIAQVSALLTLLVLSQRLGN